MNTTCPTCGADTITTPTGRHLNPQRSRVGRYLPDGYELTPNEQRNKNISAHMLHHCPPGATQPASPPPLQEALF